MSKGRAAMASAQAPVIDLCDSDEEGRNEAGLGVARLPVSRRQHHDVITILNDDEDDFAVRCRQSRERIRRAPSKTSSATSPVARRRVCKSIAGRAPPVSSRKGTPIPSHVTPINLTNTASMPTAATPSTTPLQDILDVFPDVHPNHVQTLMQQHGNPTIVADILATNSYPKSKTPGSATAYSHTQDIVLHRNKRKRQYKYDFMSPSSFEPTEDYIQQAVAQILLDFPFISVSGGRKLMKQYIHFSICHDAICQAIMGGPLSKDADQQEEQYRLLKKAMSGVPLEQDQHTRLMVGTRRMTILSPRKAPKPSSVSNAILLEEIDYVQQKQAEWKREVTERLARKQTREKAEQTHATMECPCCCFDVALDEMIACREEGHLFCVDCLRRFAENQIFTLGSFGTNSKTKKPATDLLCMHGDGCSSGFDVAHLRKALPERIMQKYDELQYRAAADAAGIELL